MEPRIVILAGGASSRMKHSAQRADAKHTALAREAMQKPKAMISVGENGAPFLDYLLSNVEGAGYRDAVIVVGEGDTIIRGYYESQRCFPNLRFSFVEQTVPPGKTKPLGAADALLTALELRADWAGGKFTVCNSDNLYSVNALRLLLESPDENALIDYDRAALNFPSHKITQFAVLRKDADGFVTDILEKPGDKELANAADATGKIGVSMNIFRFTYLAIMPYLRSAPVHPVRQEKELPGAVRPMVLERSRCMKAIPLAEHVPDITTLEDVLAFWAQNRNDS